jgi:hypothetical protein
MIVLNSKPVEYIPDSQKGKDKPATFLVKAPTREVILKIQDLFQESLVIGDEITPDKITQTFKYSDYAALILDECVVGWKNVFTKNEKGEVEELPFSKENLSLITDLNIISGLVSFIDSLGFLE